MKALFARDFRLLMLRGADGLSALFFFFAALALFPFALGSDAGVMRMAAAGLIWVALLLSSLMSVESLYHRDYQDGTFDLLLMSEDALSVTAAKVLGQFVFSSLPLLLASLVAAVMFDMPWAVLSAVFPSLVLGAIYMCLLSSAGAMLTLGARRPGVLLALIILPLFIPMLVLGMLAADAAALAKPVHAYMLLQLALVVFALPAFLLASSQLLKAGCRA